MEEKEVENRSIRCVGCLYWDWNRYHFDKLAGQPVRLKFNLEKTKLYSVWVD